jgi:hypothetical protein
MSLLKEFIMTAKVKSSFLTKWIKEINKAMEQRRQRRITAYNDKQWDRKLRGLK